MIKKIIPPIYRMILGTFFHNFKGFFRKKPKVNPSRKIVIVVASPHKVGSTWVYKILRDLTAFHEIFPSYKIFRELRKVRIPLDDLTDYFSNLKKGRGYLFKSHSLPPKVQIDDVYYISVIRDPRDLIVSLSNYVSHLPVKLGGWGEKFSKMDDRNKIIEVINKSDFIYELYSAWANYDNCLLFKYEDLKKDIYSCIVKLVDFTNIDTTDRMIKKSITKNDFKKISGRKSGNENKNSFLRKGVVGDWKNHFDDELLKYFYTTQNGRWKEIIVKNHYEL